MLDWRQPTPECMETLELPALLAPSWVYGKIEVGIVLQAVTCCFCGSRLRDRPNGWEWVVCKDGKPSTEVRSERTYKTSAAARRAAERWLRKVGRIGEDSNGQ